MLTADPEVIYGRQYWQPYRWSFLPIPTAVKAFGSSVCMGRAMRSKFQRACWAARRQVAEDGLLGEETTGAPNSFLRDWLPAAPRSEPAAHLRLIAAARPRRARFLTGWLTRA